MFVSIGSRAGRNRRVWGVAPHVDQNGARTAYDLDLVSPFPVANRWGDSNYYQNRLSFSAGGGLTDYGSILFGGQFNLRGYIAAYQGSVGIGMVSVNQAGYLSSAKALGAPIFLFNSSNGNAHINFSAGAYNINGDTKLFRNNAVGNFGVASNSDATGAAFAVYGLGGPSASGGTLSNYSRITISAAAGGGATIATEGLGSGAAGSISLDTPSSVRIIRSAANTGGNLTIVGGAGSNTSGSIGNTWALGVTGTDGTTYTAGIRADGFVSGTAIGTSDGNTAAFDQVSTPKGTKVCNTGMFTFSSGGAWWQTIDLAFARNAAGVAEVNNGTASSASLANLRDLKLRNLIFADGTSLSAIPTVSADPLAMSNIYGGL